jgi:hypothetical protein
VKHDVACAQRTGGGERRGAAGNRAVRRGDQPYVRRSHVVQRFHGRSASDEFDGSARVVVGARQHVADLKDALRLPERRQRSSDSARADHVQRFHGVEPIIPGTPSTACQRCLTSSVIFKRWTAPAAVF